MASAPRPGPTPLPTRRTAAVTAAPSPSPAPPRDEPPALLDTLLRTVRRRKWWILQALVLVPLVVGLLTARQAKQYDATASLLFRDASTSVLNDSGSSGYVDPSRQAATNSGLIDLPVIAARASQALGGRVSPAAVQASVKVGSAAQSDLVAIDATAADPVLAAQIANRYGEAYIDFRRLSDQRQLQNAVALARARLAQLTPAQRTSASGTALQDRLTRLELAQSLQTGGAELVQRATVPTTPSSPSMKRNLILGLLLGGVLGLGLGALRERFDRSIKSEGELEEIYGVPVLMRLPRSRQVGARDAAELERSAEAEAFRILRANLRYFDVDGKLTSVLVSSPLSGDGKSTVARGLAMTMAAMGDHVVLVEGDLHKGASPTLGGRVPDRGLSTVLAGDPLDEALLHVPVGERQLTLLPGGPPPPNPVELLESNRMAQLLTVLERRFEIVIIDSPALADVSDARSLVGEVSGVLVVSALGHTTRAAAVDFRKQLGLLEGNPLGVVANLAPAPRTSGYYGGS